MTIVPPPQPESPKWSPTTKTVVGLAIAALIATLVIYFRNIIGPLLLAFILAFIVHPVTAWASRTIKISWRAAVNLVYLVIILIVIALITLSGLAIIQQAQSLISSVDRFIRSLPEVVSELSTQSFSFGPFRFNFSQLDLQSLTNQLLNIVQPAIGQAGTLLGKFATGAATSFGWGFFILIVSYFLLSEGGQLRENLLHIEIPGYHSDVQILVRKLSATWDAFLRGQLLISLLVVVAYYIMLTILGTRLAIVIALMAGLARFVPYLGPLVTWTMTAIVAFFQIGNHFGLQPLPYTLLVIGCCILLDQIFDNVVVPRMLGQTLGLHPAGVLVAAIVATRLIGLVGLVLAAPVLATIMLVGGYVSRKMFDLPPWPTVAQEKLKSPLMPWIRLRRRLEAIWGALQQRK
jgi:predicted PurR-regulated permease PerM